MRKVFLVIVAGFVALTVGCGKTPWGGLMAPTGKLSAKADDELTKENPLGEIMSVIASKIIDKDEDGLISPEDVDYAEGTKDKADYDPQDGDVTIGELAWGVKAGWLEIREIPLNPKKKAKVVFAKDAPPPVENFEKLERQRNYYATNPDNGLNWYGNQAKVRDFDIKMVAVAIQNATEYPKRDPYLARMRDYYNNVEKPPFDGLGPQGHQQRLRNLEQEFLRIGKETATLEMLYELRRFMTEGRGPNDGRTLSDKQQFIQAINDAIDAVIGSKGDRNRIPDQVRR